MQIQNAAAAQAGAYAKAALAQPRDAGQPKEPQEKSLIRRGIEEIAGLTGGAVSAVYHAPIGTVKGMAEGLAEYKNSPGKGWYNFMFLGQAVGLGAVAGLAYAGPVGAVIGAGVGLVGGALVRGGLDYARADEKWIDAVEKAVDRAVEDNTEGTRLKIAVQNATEGAIVGTAVGFKEGWKVGREAGKGVVGGVLDAAAGVAEGLKEVLFGA